MVDGLALLPITQNHVMFQTIRVLNFGLSYKAMDTDSGYISFVGVRAFFLLYSDINQIRTDSFIRKLLVRVCVLLITQLIAM